jgi:hypothetical protein
MLQWCGVRRAVRQDVRENAKATVLGCVALLATTTRARADDSYNLASTVSEVTNPLPIRQQVAFKPSFTFPDGDADFKAEFQLEARLPYPGVIIPGLAMSKLTWSIARLQLTGEASSTVGGSEDMTFVDAVARRFGLLTLAFGFGSVLPLATSSTLGQGKWQFGPAAAIRLDPSRVVKLAALVQVLSSVAGNSQMPNVAYVSAQPFMTFHITRALFVSSDATM